MNKLIPAICKKVAGIFNFKLCQNNQQTLKDGASSITIDAATGNVERVKFGYQSASFGTKTDQWLSTLHMGHISLGKDEQLNHLLYQLFLVLIGLAVTVLSGTGAYLWYKGRQQRITAKRKSAQRTINKQARLNSELIPYPQSLDGLDDAAQ